MFTRPLLSVIRSSSLWSINNFCVNSLPYKECAIKNLSRIAWNQPAICHSQRLKSTRAKNDLDKTIKKINETTEVVAEPKPKASLPLVQISIHLILSYPSP